MAATYQDKTPGERWSPEPAARYNAVNRLVNRTDAGGAGVPAPINRGNVLVTAEIVSGGVFSSGATLSAYTPVVLGGNLVRSNPGDPAAVVFGIERPASASDPAWGVTQARAATGMTVTVLLQGVTPVSAAGVIAAGDPLAVSGGLVVSGAGGAARALTATASGGVILAQLGVGGGAAPGYSSYFKISVAPPISGGAVVTIADGATGSDSIAVVNGGSTYSLPPYTETVSGGALFLLKYTPAQYNSGGGIASSASMVVSSLHESGGIFPTLPSGGTSGAYYYQLGRVLWSGGSGAPEPVQDHTAGVVQFQWFANCFLG